MRALTHLLLSACQYHFKGLIASHGSNLPNLVVLFSKWVPSLVFVQSLLRRREGEVSQLRREVARLNEAHECLLSALSEQTAKAELQVALGDGLGGEASLSQRYEVLLQLYGQKLEENNELRMDLREAKEAYQSQLTELLNKLNGDNR